MKMKVHLRKKLVTGRSPYYERPAKNERKGDDISICLTCKKKSCKGECEDIKRK